jgi:CheY-like chemotaxis protein
MVDQNAGLKGLRVLAVDDYADASALLKFSLELYGIEVIAVESASAALEVFTRSPVDALIADIAMPDEDGYTLMRQVRALPINQGGAVPAIALTAFAAPEGYQEAIDAGFQTYLVKPVEPDRLVQALADLMTDSARNACVNVCSASVN